MEARLNLSFLLEYLRSLAHALFQRKASRDLDVKIVIAGSSHTLAFFFFFFFFWVFFCVVFFWFFFFKKFKLYKVLSGHIFM